MLSAKAARELALEQLEWNTNVELELIEEQIKEAASNGEFSVSKEGTLTLHCRTKLEELGYKVRVGNQYNETYYTISW